MIIADTVTEGETEAPVVAAGAVCWRSFRGSVQVLTIRRDRHGDVSLPKGKLDPDERVPVAAVREVREETGFAVRLGIPLGTTEYLLPSGRDKVVYYWAAEVVEEEYRAKFRPNDEVQSLRWSSVAGAKSALTYERDADVLDRFQELVDRGVHRSFAMITLRHGKAEVSSSKGDAARKLSARGTAQANALATVLAAWGPEKVLTSPAVRCVLTVAPLAATLGKKPTKVEAIAQDTWEGAGRAPDAATQLDVLVAKRIAKRETTVLCSHTPVLPAIVESIGRLARGENDRRLDRIAMLSTGDFSVLHLSVDNPGQGILAVETHSPLA